MVAMLRRVPDGGIEYLSPVFRRAEMENSSFTFVTGDKESVLGRMASKVNFLLDGRTEVAQGIVSPQDFVNRSSAEALDGRASVGDGIFVLSSAERLNLGLTKEEQALVRPYYTTDELGRFAGKKSNALWIIYTDSEFKNKSAMQPFPNLRKHLNRFAAVITSDNAPYGLHRARDERFFKGEKIVALRKCVAPTFTFTDFDCYVSQTFNVIKTARVNQKYLTGLLNSSAVAFWLRHKGKRQGQLYQVDKEPLLGIPLIKPDSARETMISASVNAIIGLSLAGHVQLLPKWEQLINGLVYELYFAEELGKANVRLFEAVEKAGVGRLATARGDALVRSAIDIAEGIFATDHAIYGMLFDLQALDVVRIIEEME